MAVYQALLLAAAVPALLMLAAWLRLHAVIALLTVALCYGLAADMSVSYLAQSVSAGFAQTIEEVGLVIIAAQIAATFADRAADRTGPGPRPAWRWILPLSFAGGLAHSAPAALALLGPLLRPLGAGAAGAALVLVAAHGLLPPAPGPVAAAAILGADPLLVAGLGLLVAIPAAAAGWLYVAVIGGSHGDAEPPSAAAAASPPDWRLLLPLALPLLLLIVQSVGQIPSEPLGSGPARETVIAFGRPIVLFAICVAGTVLVHGKLGPLALSEAGWMGEAVAKAAPLVFLAGAAGAFAKVLQNTGMAELMGERLLAAPLGLLLALLAAAAIKTLQGSSLVAVLTAAGMVAPLLPGAGLDGEAGRALAALAVGAGAMAAIHVNDSTFWIAARAGRLAPGAALVLLSGGSVVQAGVAAFLLLALAAILL